MLTIQEFVKYAFFSLGILAIVIIAPALYYFGSPNWLTRKFTHILANTIAAVYMVWFDNLVVILFVLNFGILLTLLLTLPPIKLLFRIIEHSTRKDESSKIMAINAAATMGVVIAYYFILIFTGLDHPLLILGGILPMSVGDGMGEVIGRPFGKHRFKITGEKSVEGSAAVFLSTFICLVVSSAIYFSVKPYVILYLFAVSVLVMLIEMVSVDFWDNLVLPFISGFALYFLIF